jgi:hypothetical protein
METIAAFAIIVFLLGLFFGLPYQQASKRRQALLEQEKNDLPESRSARAPLDKSLSSS